MLMREGKQEEEPVGARVEGRHSVSKHLGDCTGGGIHWGGETTKYSVRLKEMPEKEEGRANSKK